MKRRDGKQFHRTVGPRPAEKKQCCGNAKKNLQFLRKFNKIDVEKIGRFMLIYRKQKTLRGHTRLQRSQLPYYNMVHQKNP